MKLALAALLLAALAAAPSVPGAQANATTLAADAATAFTVAGAGELDLHVSPRLSPNGDGRFEHATVRFFLKRASEDVTLSIDDGHVLRKQFGALTRGAHTFTWSGRDKHGELVGDGFYRVEVHAGYATRDLRDFRQIAVDTEFSAGLQAASYGAPRSSGHKVFPRSTVVTDALPLEATAEGKATRAELRIVDGDGKIVLRKDVRTERTGSGAWAIWARRVDWTARRQDSPLPVGRYRAYVVGRDKFGNRGRSRTERLYVSRDKLVWHEETRTLPAAETVAPCSLEGAKDCWIDSYCGEVVPSPTVAGALSYRSATCPPSWGGLTSPYAKAVSPHIETFPDSVRGLDRVQIGFAGAPTHAGESDPGTLSAGSESITSSTAAVSAWDEDPVYADGFDGAGPTAPRFAPAAYWRFSTSGDDSFDVTTFTVSARYLIAAP